MRTSSPIRFDRLIRHVVVSAVAAALAYFAFCIFVGWREVVDAIGRVGGPALCAALALSGVNYGLRFVRWQMYLRALGHSIPNGPSAVIYLSGFAFTTTPGKAGELLRGVFLHRRGTPYAGSTAAFLSERVSDLTAVLILCLPGVVLLPAPVAVAALAAVACGVAALALAVKLGLPTRLAALLLRRRGRLSGLLQHAMPLLTEAKRCNMPRMLLAASGLSLLAWGAEALAFALVLHLLGITLPVPLAIFIYAASMIAGALSFLPGGLGGAEATMIGLLAFCGAPHPESVAATILIRLTTLWFAVALGILLAISGRRTLLAPAAGHA